MKNSDAKTECTEAGADAYVLLDTGSVGDDLFVVEPPRDEVDFAPPTGECGLDLEEIREQNKHIHK